MRKKFRGRASWNYKKILKQKLKNQRREEKKKIREENAGKVKVSSKYSDEDWYMSTIFSKAQILAFIFVAEKFIKNPMHQPQRQEFMN